jgi:hypothetical protein
MTIIKNHFEVFLMTSKKAGHYRVKSWVIFNKMPVHTYLSVKYQLWPIVRV